MSPAEIIALVEALRACGVTRYKNDGVELELGAAPPKAPTAAELKEQKEIIHKVEEMTSLLKLDDANLVDRLFPDHTIEGTAEESALDN